MRFARFAIAAVAAFPIVGAAATVAHAQPAPNVHEAVIAAGGVLTAPEGAQVQLLRNEKAPDCVVAKKEKAAVQVYNNCATDVRVKVIMTGSVVGAKDSECKTVVAGTRTNIRPTLPNEKIDGVVAC